MTIQILFQYEADGDFSGGVHVTEAFKELDRQLQKVGSSTSEIKFSIRAAACSAIENYANAQTTQLKAENLRLREAVEREAKEFAEWKDKYYTLYEWGETPQLYHETLRVSKPYTLDQLYQQYLKSKQ